MARIVKALMFNFLGILYDNVPEHTQSVLSIITSYQYNGLTSYYDVNPGFIILLFDDQSII